MFYLAENGTSLTQRQTDSQVGNVSLSMPCNLDIDLQIKMRDVAGGSEQS